MRPGLIIAVVAGTIAQVAMVLAGHVAPAVAQLFAIGGTGISLLAGLLFAALARPSWPSAAVGGALAGGLCAALGIGLSVALGDVPWTLLLLGTAASTVAGLLGGLAGRVVFRP